MGFLKQFFRNVLHEGEPTTVSQCVGGFYVMGLPIEEVLVEDDRFAPLPIFQNTATIAATKWIAVLVCSVMADNCVF